MEKQVAILRLDAIRFFDDKNYVKLIELLNSVSPMVAILINYKISLVNHELEDLSYTLS